MTSQHPVGPPVPGSLPLVLAGHGTRDPAGVAESLALADRVRSLLPGVRVVPAFVELTSPGIEEALRAVLADDPDGVVVVPLMIGSGGHVRADIPEAIAAGRRSQGRTEVAYARHLGAPALMVSAALQRIDTARDDWDAAEVVLVVVGRGCCVADANADHARLTRLLQESGGYARAVPAFIQVARPSVAEALDMAYAVGSRRLVVMPHYLFPGRLTTWVRDAARDWSASHPEASVRVADPIGDCPELAELVVLRYRESTALLRPQPDLPGVPVGAPPQPSARLRGLHMSPRDYEKNGAEIYSQSFATIEAEADLAHVPESLRPAVIRMIHASGQTDLVDDIAWSQGFAEAATTALLRGAPILCDSRMVASGIIRSRLPRDNTVVCLLDDPELPALAARLSTTKAAAAVDLWVPLLPGAVVAIGNAPTALFHLLEVVTDDPALTPAAVVGIPVGFVGAAESKRALAENTLGLDFLVVHGRRGGSAVTAAAVNALCGKDGTPGG